MVRTGTWGLVNPHTGTYGVVPDSDDRDQPDEEATVIGEPEQQAANDDSMAQPEDQPEEKKE